jgi:hypothetical protein
MSPFAAAASPSEPSPGGGPFSKDTDGSLLTSFFFLLFFSLFF